MTRDEEIFARAINMAVRKLGAFKDEPRNQRKIAWYGWAKSKLDESMRSEPIKQRYKAKRLPRRANKKPKSAQGGEGE